MAVVTVINGVAVAPNATSATADMTLTVPATGVDLTITAPKVGTVEPLFGVAVLAQESLDGTVFGAPVKVAETVPGETKTFYHDAKNCTKVRYSVRNRDSSVSVTATLTAVQV